MLRWFFILLFSLQVQATETLTVVAVGDAQKEAENIFFKYESSDLVLSQKQKDQWETLKAIVKSDFDFYRSLFSIQEKQSQSIRYLVSVVLKKQEDSYVLDFKTEDQAAKKVLAQGSVAMNFGQIRGVSHELSDQVYVSITGKKSIFKTKIYFVSDRTSLGKRLSKELYVMDFDGANKKRLTYYNSLIISPSLSFDNTKVVYTLVENKVKKTSRADGSVHDVKNLNLHLMNLETKKTKLISSIDGINSGAIFNKKGDSLYLTLSYQKNADIFKLNLNSGLKQRVTRHYSDDVDPFINAEENLLTFLSGRAGKAMIYTLDPSGIEKQVKRISFVGRFNAAPRFNPEGSEIVFSSWLDERFDLFRIGSDGKNLVRLTKNFGSNEEPWFSPDGQFIVFTSQRVISQRKATQDVYIMDRNGEILRKITEGFGRIFTPRWSN